MKKLSVLLAVRANYTVGGTLYSMPFNPLKEAHLSVSTKRQIPTHN